MKSYKLIDFGKLLKTAWEYVWHNKFLWLLGLLAGGSIGASSNNAGYIFDSGGTTQDWQSMQGLSNFSQISNAGKVMGVSDAAISNSLILSIVIVGICLAIILIYLNITARGAIISTVNKLDSGNKTNLRESWALGHKYFWKILVYGLLVFAVLIIPLLFLSTPIVLMALVRWYIPAIIVGILFFIIYILYAIYIMLSVQYGERILVIDNANPWRAFKLGLAFFNKHWRNVLLVYLMLVALSLGAGTVLAISMLILLGTFGALVYGAYLIHIIVAYIIGIPLVLAFIAVMLAASGLVASYQSTVYTLSYKEILREN